MRLGFSLVSVLFGMWMLWSGAYSWPGTEHFHALILSLGVASCFFVLVLSMRMKIVDIEALPLHISWRLLFYVPWLLKEIFMANINVARLILSPKMPISPNIIKVEAFQETELAQMIYANSITLTPGTVSVDLVDGMITVHSITHDATEALIQGDMDLRTALLEGKKDKKGKKGK